MNIYDLTDSDLKDMMKKFNITSYGSIIFIISYAIPLILLMTLVLLILLFACVFNTYWVCFFPIFIMLVVLLILSLVLGSKYYLKELRLFIMNQGTEHKKHKSLMKMLFGKKEND